MNDAEKVQQFLSQIKNHLVQKPSDTEVVITELNSIINKYDEEINKQLKPKLPLIDPAFKAQVKAMKEKIYNVIGIKLKIPDLRYEASKLSKEIGIPLPNSTKKNNEALLQWFNSNWEQLEPYLYKLKGKIKPRGLASE